jgi:5'-3' exonuclease
MGIKDFTKVFQSNGEIKWSKLRGKTIAIDASIEIFKACLGMSSIHTLTDKDGKATTHINVMIYNIVKYINAGINQIWVFDNGSCAPLKVDEVNRRRERREKIRAELERKRQEDEFYSDEEDKLEKQCFSINSEIIGDIKFILDCLNVQWCEAPQGYEAECVCAMMTHDEKINAYAVISNDPDTLMFGAKRLIRKSRKDKKNYMFGLKRLLATHHLTLDEFQKIGVILGCDFCKKTPRIGPKTIMNKFRQVELTGEQRNAIGYFNNCPNVGEIILYNDGGEVNRQMVAELVKWLVDDKGFSSMRMNKLFSKFLIS